MLTRGCGLNPHWWTAANTALHGAEFLLSITLARWWTRRRVSRVVFNPFDGVTLVYRVGCYIYVVIYMLLCNTAFLVLILLSVFVNMFACCLITVSCD